MAHDYRYQNVLSIWKAGDLKSFNQIFTIIPKYIIADDLGVNYGRFASKTHDPHLLTFKDAVLIGDLIRIPPRAMIDLILVDIESLPAYQNR